MTGLLTDFAFRLRLSVLRERGLEDTADDFEAERAARLAAEERAEKAEKERETILAEALEWREKFECMKDTAAAEAEAFEDQKLRAATAIAERDAARAEVARLYKALLNIAEGNLGDDPWQAGYSAIRALALAAPSPEPGDRT